MLDRLVPHNEHTLDRIARVVLGLGVLSLTVIGPKTLWGLAGLIFVVTGLAGRCPIYAILGLKTCRD